MRRGSMCAHTHTDRLIVDRKRMWKYANTPKSFSTTREKHARQRGHVSRKIYCSRFTVLRVPRDVVGLLMRVGCHAAHVTAILQTSQYICIRRTPHLLISPHQPHITRSFRSSGLGSAHQLPQWDHGWLIHLEYRKCRPSLEGHNSDTGERVEQWKYPTGDWD